MPAIFFASHPLVGGAQVFLLRNSRLGNFNLRNSKLGNSRIPRNKIAKNLEFLGKIPPTPNQRMLSKKLNNQRIVQQKERMRSNQRMRSKKTQIKQENSRF